MQEKGVGWFKIVYKKGQYKLQTYVLIIIYSIRFAWSNNKLWVVWLIVLKYNTHQSLSLTKPRLFFFLDITSVSNVVWHSIARKVRHKDREVYIIIYNLHLKKKNSNQGTEKKNSNNCWNWQKFYKSYPQYAYILN